MQRNVLLNWSKENRKNIPYFGIYSSSISHAQVLIKYFHCELETFLQEYARFALRICATSSRKLQTLSSKTSIISEKYG